MANQQASGDVFGSILHVRKRKRGQEDHLSEMWPELSSYIQNPRCVFCNLPDLLPLIQSENAHGAIGLQTAICRSCGFLFRSRTLPPQWFDKHFSQRWLTNKNAKVVLAPDDAVYRRIGALLGASKRILDVGCGAGQKLLPFLQAGHHVFGVEPSESQCVRARQLLGMPIEQGTGQSFFAKCDERYDAIIFHNVLQFTENPRYLLEAALERLEVGGVLFVKDAMLECKPLLTLVYQAVERSYFSPGMLANFLRNRGCELSVTENQAVEIVARKLSEVPPADFPSAGQEYTADVYRIIREKCSVGYWGRIFGRQIRDARHKRAFTVKAEGFQGALPYRFVHPSDGIPILAK
jgi:SAM-dependent methyltransferase